MATGMQILRMVGEPSSFFITPYDTLILSEPSLVHYWKVYETAGSTTIADSKGSLTLNVHNATLGSPALYGTPTCAFVNNTNQWINNTGANMGTSSTWTYEATIKIASQSLTNTIIMSNGNFGTNRNDFDLSLPDASHAFLDFSGIRTDTTNLGYNIIHLVQATYDGTTLRFYVDGALKTSFVVAVAASGGNGAGIGNRGDSASPTGGMGGYVNRCAFYNTALTGTQIANHWNSRNA